MPQHRGAIVPSCSQVPSLTGLQQRLANAVDPCDASHIQLQIRQADSFLEGGLQHIKQSPAMVDTGALEEALQTLFLEASRWSTIGVRSIPAKTFDQALKV